MVVDAPSMARRPQRRACRRHVSKGLGRRGACVKIVVRMPNWLGDAVMALPAVGAVRAAFPSAHRTIAAIQPVAPMFEEMTPAGQQEILVVEKSNEAERLRAGTFESILLLPNSFRSAWTARQAGIAN